MDINICTPVRQMFLSFNRYGLLKYMNRFSIHVTIFFSGVFEDMVFFTASEGDNHCTCSQLEIAGKQNGHENSSYLFFKIVE